LIPSNMIQCFSRLNLPSHPHVTTSSVVVINILIRVAAEVLKFVEVSHIRSLIRHPRFYTIFMSRGNVGDIRGYRHQVSAVGTSEPVPKLYSSLSSTNKLRTERRPTRPENGTIVKTQLPNGGRWDRYRGQSGSIEDSQGAFLS
jgi:hypothetical protein